MQKIICELFGGGNNISMIESLVIGIAGSFVASVVFWVLTFKISRTKVLFSESIECFQPDDGARRYRIRMANYRKTMALSAIDCPIQCSEAADNTDQIHP